MSVSTLQASCGGEVGQIQVSSGSSGLQLQCLKGFRVERHTELGKSLILQLHHQAWRGL